MTDTKSSVFTTTLTVPTADVWKAVTVAFHSVADQAFAPVSADEMLSPFRPVQVKASITLTQKGDKTPGAVEEDDDEWIEYRVDVHCFDGWAFAMSSNSLTEAKNYVALNVGRGERWHIVMVQPTVIEEGTKL